MTDRLLDPVTGVGGKPQPEPGIELLGRSDQTQVSLADQVIEDEAAALELAGDRDDQAEVGADHADLGRLVAAGDQGGHLALLVARKPASEGDIAGSVRSGIDAMVIALCYRAIGPFARRLIVRTTSGLAGYPRILDDRWSVS